MMQVVESYIRDQTLITAYQAYVEANFINDMMNFQNQLMENVIQRQLREVIQEILSEIYVASTASLMLENIVNKELMLVCQHCFDSEFQERKEILDQDFNQ